MRWIWLAFAFMVTGWLAGIDARPVHAQSAAALCQAGQAVEYVHAGRRYPGRVEGNNGQNCLVYAKAYMGVIDVAFDDLRSASGASENGAPDVALASSAAMIATTPKEIVEAFRINPDAAKARFVNRPVRITGAINTFDDKSIWMKANLYQTAAVCLLEPENRGALQGLTEISAITVEGTASDRGNESIFVQNCRVVQAGKAPTVAAGPNRPPLGQYLCRSAGQGIGGVTLSAGGYSVDGVSGAMRYDPASRRLTFTSGSYAKWGWSGEWRTDPDGVGGPPEPRIVLTDGQSLKVTCTLQH